jgi:cell division septation protein DedD
VIALTRHRPENFRARPPYAASAAKQTTAAADAATAAAAVPQKAPPPAAKPAAVKVAETKPVTPATRPRSPRRPNPSSTPAPAGAQLGAFGVEANARNLWSALGKKYPAVAAHQPSYVKSGTVTRLQAGGFAAKSDAETFCATVRKGGQACMVVAR